MKTTYETLTDSARYTSDAINSDSPVIAIVLGSGLGDFAERAEGKIVIPYKDIPHFPVSTVKGHRGVLVYGRVSDVPVLMMQGRFHFYEGYSMDEVAYPVRVFARLGIKKLFLSNAAGCINKDWNVGDLMLIKDHIKLVMDSPSRSLDDDAIGPRFFDMSDAYSKSARSMVKEIAKAQGLALREGVYMFFSGPNFETPAEINAARILGADAAGMSTVPEAIAASQMGMETLGISLMTNMAAGILEKKLDHKEVLEEGEKAKERFSSLLEGVIKRWSEFSD